MQDNKIEWRPVCVLLMCAVSVPAQRISYTDNFKRKIPTSEVDQHAVTQKSVTFTMDVILGCGGRRSWEKKPGSQSEW